MRLSRNVKVSPSEATSGVASGDSETGIVLAAPRAELAERHRRLSMLSPVHVADAYRQAHEACRMDSDA